MEKDILLNISFEIRVPIIEKRLKHNNNLFKLS